MSDRRKDKRREQRRDGRRDGRDTAENEEVMADGGTGQTRTTTRNERRERRPPEEDRASRMGSWFASAAMRWGVILFGIVLMLFALGQAAGTNILGPIIDAMASQTGIWLIVALFALALIAAASRIR
jgi:hypothetical protein